METGKYVAGVMAGMLAGAFMGFLYARTNKKHKTKKLNRSAEAFASALDERINQKFNDFMVALEEFEKGKALKFDGKNGYHPVEADV